MIKYILLTCDMVNERNTSVPDSRATIVMDFCANTKIALFRTYWAVLLVNLCFLIVLYLPAFSPFMMKGSTMTSMNTEKPNAQSINEYATVPIGNSGDEFHEMNQMKMQHSAARMQMAGLKNPTSIWWVDCKCNNLRIEYLLMSFVLTSEPRQSFRTGSRERNPIVLYSRFILEMNCS